VDGSPAVFMHFSGIDPHHPDRISRHDTRLSFEDLGSVEELYQGYIRSLVDAGYFTSLVWPYAYGHFSNHIEIPLIARHIYREMGVARDRFGNPFDADGPGSYFRWLVEPAEEGGGEWPGLSRILYAIYRTRPDLQRLFPQPFGNDYRAFMNWVAEHGRDEY